MSDERAGVIFAIAVLIGIFLYLLHDDWTHVVIDREE